MLIFYEITYSKLFYKFLNLDNIAGTSSSIIKCLNFQIHFKQYLCIEEKFAEDFKKVIALNKVNLSVYI